MTPFLSCVISLLVCSFCVVYGYLCTLFIPLVCIWCDLYSIYRFLAWSAIYLMKRLKFVLWKLSFSVQATASIMYWYRFCSLRFLKMWVMDKFSFAICRFTSFELLKAQQCIVDTQSSGSTKCMCMLILLTTLCTEYNISPLTSHLGRSSTHSCIWRSVISFIEPASIHIAAKNVLRSSSYTDAP